MNAALLKYLWCSPEVRSLLKKEAWRLFCFVAIYVSVTALSRYVREKPVIEGVLSAAIGAAGVVLAWLVSAIRTLRSVLREHGMLEP
jgi:hypothetical protein